MQIDDLKEFISTNDAVMVYFSGEFCGVCKVLQPKIKDAFTKHYPNIKQLYIDADSFKQTAVALNIFAVPTIVVYLDGKEFARKSRNLSVDRFIQELQRPYGLFFN
jgi:thioredoxin-like negative regulator of GroEL